jgi:hypothetical protein
MEVIVDRVESARPTLPNPVLVTGPSPVGAAAAVEGAGAMVAAAEAEAVGESAAPAGIELFEPLTMPGPPIVVAGAMYECEDSALGLVGAVVGAAGVEGSATGRVPETVMVTDGLPGPQAALTVYDPDADGEIVADPLKLICVFEIDAALPTKAGE